MRDALIKQIPECTSCVWPHRSYQVVKGDRKTPSSYLLNDAIQVFTVVTAGEPSAVPRHLARQAQFSCLQFRLTEREMIGKLPENG
jgi:hypothetical protein